VSLYCKIVQGSYDASLSWPFVRSVAVSLLNQLADESHGTVVFKYIPANNARVGDISGYELFRLQSSLTHNAAKNTQYLMNDTLFFKVAVEGLQSWLHYPS